MSGVTDEGLTLRERKKAWTRQRISAAATELFIERGFEEVTVAEVAKAADVSTMTVFNYFPRKEDLFLDRIPEALELAARAVRERAEGERPLAAIRRVLLELADQRHPLAPLGDTFPRFWQVVLDSPSLRARAREGLEALECALARALAEAYGTAADDPRARLTAALTVAAYRTVYADTARRLLRGERADDVAGEHRELVNEAFDALERALPDS